MCLTFLTILVIMSDFSESVPSLCKKKGLNYREKISSFFKPAYRKILRNLQMSKVTKHLLFRSTVLLLKYKMFKFILYNFKLLISNFTFN